MPYRPISAVVLAAGEGTRMRSARPKPLHRLCGRAMVLHVLDAVAELPVERAVVVVGHGAEPVTRALLEQGPPKLAIEFVEQPAQRGTGDAAAVALTAFPEDDLDGGDVLVLPGDTPLLSPETLAALLRDHRERDAAATVLTARPDDPTGYGRIVRDRDERVRGVVEERDASDEDRSIGEVNTSVYVIRRGLLAPALRRLTPDNAQGEYYLTDVVGVLADAGYPVGTHVAADPTETLGVNDRVQLATAEALLRRRVNERWMRAGVTMVDPERTYIDVGVTLAPDVVVQPATMLHGRTVVGEGAELGPGTRLTDCDVGARAVVVHTVAADAEIGAGADVGPFAQLGAGTDIPAGTSTGPFYTAPG